MPQNSTKTCSRCQLERPIERFKRTSSGEHRAVCEACHSRERYWKNPEKYRRYKAKRRAGDAVTSIWIDSRRSDKRRGRQNDLTKEQIHQLLAAGCFYCGETQLRMTLDRIDNSIGHLATNVVPACIRCNYARKDMPHEAWLVVSVGMRQAREMGLFGEWTGRVR